MNLKEKVEKRIEYKEWNIGYVKKQINERTSKVEALEAVKSDTLDRMILEERKELQRNFESLEETELDLMALKVLKARIEKQVIQPEWD